MLIESNHTDGEWSVGEAPNAIYCGELRIGTADSVFTVKKEPVLGFEDAEQVKANARLFAASKDLLDALNLAHEFLDSLPEGWLGKTTGDIGVLNDFYLLSRRIQDKMKAGEA